MKDLIDNPVRCTEVSGREVCRIHCQVFLYPASLLMILKWGRKWQSVCKRAQLRIIKEARTLKTNNANIKTKLSAGVQLEKNSPIRLKNKLTSTILRMYISGSTRGLRVAVEEKRDHNCSLKKSPVLWYDIHNVSQGNETIFFYKGDKMPNQTVKQGNVYFVLVLFC